MFGFLVMESLPAFDRTEYSLRVALPVDREVYNPRCSTGDSPKKDNPEKDNNVPGPNRGSCDACSQRIGAHRASNPKSARLRRPNNSGR